MSKQTDSDTPQIECMGISCYGIVKEYSEDGVREVPDEAIDEYGAIKYKCRDLLEKIPYIDFNELTWHECSMCHRYHSEGEL